MKPNNTKNKFALQLQQQIGQKRPPGDSAVNWFANKLSHTSQSEVKPTNVYKWLSGGSAREVPGKFIKRKDGNSQDPISQALGLDASERVQLIDAFFTSFAYNDQAKGALLHLLDSPALEALDDTSRYKMLHQGKGNRIATALDKFFAGIDCPKDPQSDPLLPDDVVVAPLCIMADDQGLLSPTHIDAFVGLVNALYSAGYTLQMVLCFGTQPYERRAAKVDVLKKMFPLLFADGCSDGQSHIDLRVVQNSGPMRVYDSILFNNGRTGYTMLDQTHLVWQNNTAATLFGTEFNRLRAMATIPFVRIKAADLPRCDACGIANADAPLNHTLPTYVLGQWAKNLPSNAIATDSNDRLGDNWVKFSYILQEGTEQTLFLIPYYIDDYIDNNALDDIRRMLRDDTSPVVFAVQDSDLVETAHVYRCYLDEVSVVPHD